ncbi:MAG: acetyl-CoA carboxylase, carboxyltransferase subunit beta [Bacteroidia bacterium]
MSWFKRVKDGILTRTEDKTEAPDGMWSKCPECKKATHHRALEEHHYVCPECDYHFRIGSAEYFGILLGDHPFKVHFDKLAPGDPLEFVDSKKYPDRIKETIDKTHLPEAVRVAESTIDDEPVVVACMDFRFIGGSMGAVMGEAISRGIDISLEKRIPFIIISKSGGARMMEGAFSLMQMAKVSAKLALLAEAKVPYFSILTDPTTGGVTASFAMLGDFNIAEPKALIGFAGPRVIRETIGKDLPEGFQKSEFLLKHGFLDFICHRKDLKHRLHTLIKLLK